MDSRRANATDNISGPPAREESKRSGARAISRNYIYLSRLRVSNACSSFRGSLQRLYQNEFMALILPHLSGSIFGQFAVPQDRIIISSVPREAADQLVRSLTEPHAVRIKTGVEIDLDRNVFKTLRPSRPGSITSRMIASKRVPLIRSSASFPSPQRSTAKPSSTSARRMKRAALLSSSTTKTLTVQ
jgi:hypothetical protein